jgi:ATP-dependent Lon protease
MTPRKKIIISEENTLSDIVNDKNDINEENKKTNNITQKKILPVIPLKDVVIYPYMLYPVLAGRESTIKAIEKANEDDKYVFVTMQINRLDEKISTDNLYKTGTIAKIVQSLRMPNGFMKILVDGLKVGVSKGFTLTAENIVEAEVTEINLEIINNNETEALLRQADKLFREYINNTPAIPKESLINYEAATDPEKKAYYIASTLNIDLEKKQELLEQKTIKELYTKLIYILSSELEISNIVKEIDTKVYNEMQKNQRKFIVQEQIKILQEELGENVETDPELSKLLEKIESCGMPDNVLEKAKEEFGKLKKTPTMSPDFSVTRNYLDWLVSVPWNTYTEDNFDLVKARQILDEDHYDLEKPKERIIELLAVLKLLKDKNISKPPKGQILCLVGPPGVGKTSLGKSIARALNRKFARLSVGGVRDESEIRGHRRTYVGSMPGKIIQAMKKTGTCNPVILIDEIDKMGTDWRGDPASAMLEVLDPEQNHAFNDHYLEVDYDLSKVLFITTANVKYNIPPALQDRMETIEMRSYLDFEKVQIAKRHIIPKELAEHGMENDDVVFPDNVIMKIVREYTRESGVRNLERELTTIIRKIARDKVMGKSNTTVIKVTDKMVEDFLGVRKFSEKKSSSEKEKIGSIVGLAWTSMGGDILNIDVTIMKGQNRLTLTGNLGDVMKESAQAGLSYIKSNVAKFKIPVNYFKDKEIHLHVPEGAIPKDGPSAGITITLAMLSAITQNPVRTDVAMTGEITLRGDVLPIGGLSEKLLAATRYGIKTVLIPNENLKDLEEVPEEIKKNLKIVPLKKIDEALAYVFGKKKVTFLKSRN